MGPSSHDSRGIGRAQEATEKCQRVFERVRGGGGGRRASYTSGAWHVVSNIVPSLFGPCLPVVSSLQQCALQPAQLSARKEALGPAAINV